MSPNEDNSEIIDRIMKRVTEKMKGAEEEYKKYVEEIMRKWRIKENSQKEEKK